MCAVLCSVLRREDPQFWRSCNLWIVWPAVIPLSWGCRPVELGIVPSTHISSEIWVSKHSLLPNAFRSHPLLLCDSGKPTCMGIAVAFSPCMSRACQLDNVPICQLYFAVTDLTVAIPLPAAPILQVEGCPCGKVVGNAGRYSCTCTYTTRVWWSRWNSVSFVSTCSIRWDSKKGGKKLWDAQGGQLCVLARWLLWFNPSWQLSTMHLLTHFTHTPSQKDTHTHTLHLWDGERSEEGKENRTRGLR